MLLVVLILKMIISSATVVIMLPGFAQLSFDVDVGPFELSIGEKF